MGMVAEKDFILRLTQEFATMLSALLGLRKKKQHEQALEQLATGADGLLGVPRSVLEVLDAAGAARMLGDPLKIRMYARLLREEAETLAEMGRDGLHQRRRAAELIVEASRLKGGAKPEDRLELSALGEVPLSERYAAEAQKLRS